MLVALLRSWFCVWSPVPISTISRRGKQHMQSTANDLHLKTLPAFNLDPSISFREQHLLPSVIILLTTIRSLFTVHNGPFSLLVDVAHVLTDFAHTFGPVRSSPAGATIDNEAAGAGGKLEVKGDQWRRRYY